MKTKINSQQKKVRQPCTTFALFPLLFIVAAQENVLVNNSNIEVQHSAIF